MLSLAAGSTDEEGFAAWLHDNTAADGQPTS
jgi:hypothetical protein